MTVRHVSGRRLSVLLIAVVVVGLVIASGVLSKRRESQRKAVTNIPPVSSKVKALVIVGTKIINENTPGVGVSVEIRNISDRAVMAIDLVCGDGAVTKNGLTDEEKPIVVIEPYGRTTIEMSFSEMTADVPLVVSAATYVDGSEEGDPRSLRRMHQTRDHDRAKMLEFRNSQKDKKKP